MYCALHINAFSTVPEMELAVYMRQITYDPQITHEADDLRVRTQL
jgi:hypothetical protein